MSNKFQVGDLVKLNPSLHCQYKSIFKVIQLENNLIDYEILCIERGNGQEGVEQGATLFLNEEALILHKRRFEEYKSDTLDIIVNEQIVSVIKEVVCVELLKKDIKGIKKTIKDDDGEINLSKEEIKFIKGIK